jgi:hypothetical protein
MDCYSDHKPHDYVSGNCVSCGFWYQTETGFMNLEELNDARSEYNENRDYSYHDDEDYLMPLKELPEQNAQFGEVRDLEEGQIILDLQASGRTSVLAQ